MEREISIAEIMENQFQSQEGDFIVVNTVWSSGPPEPKKPCCFIFADKHGYHIGAVLFYKTEKSKNVYQKLKNVGCRFKIKNFTVNAVETPEYRILQTQSKQLIINQGTLNIEEGNQDVEELTTHIPFNFTMLHDLDKRRDASLIDVIGFVREIPKPQKSNDGNKEFKTVTLSSSRSTVNNVVCDLALFGDHFKSISRKNEVYAFLNVKVKDLGGEKTRIKSLGTTNNTIIIKITRDDVKLLPDVYRTDALIQKLFAKFRSKKQNQTDCRRSGRLTAQAEANSDSTVRHVSQTSMGDVEDNLPGPSTSNQHQSKNRQSTESSLNSENEYTGEEVIPAKRMRISGTVLTSSADNVSQTKRRLSDFAKKLYDFKDGRLPLKFKMTNTTDYMTNGTNTYTMRSQPRGRALIINNYYFEDDPKEPLRKGSLEDVKILTDLLRGFKFEVDIRSDLRAEQLKGVLNDFKKSFNQTMDACVVIVMSHGIHGHVKFIDGKYVHWSNDIVYQFDEKQFPCMAGKPKIFLVQACQDMPEAKDLEKAVKSDNKAEDLVLRNVIEIFAAIPGTKAERDPHLGSPFVHVFVDTLMEYAHNTDLLTLLEVVQDRLKDVKRWLENQLHCNWTRHHFNDALYFNPGL